MSVAIVFLILCVLLAAFVLCRFLLKMKRREDKFEHLHRGEILRFPQRSIRPKFYFIRSSQLSQWIDCGTDVFIFRLLEENDSDVHARYFPDELAVTHQQLSEILPWIPSSSRVVVYCTTATHLPLELRLSAMSLGRSIYVLRGSLPRVRWYGGRMECELCN